MFNFLYHWSPAANRSSIQEKGLIANSTTTLDSESSNSVCCSLTPKLAWEYSGNVHKQIKGDVEKWDLWQINLTNTDEIHLLPCWGGNIVEVRIHNDIPCDRLFWIGERTIS